MKKLSEFCDTIGAKRGDISNWIERLELKTAYATTVPGSARRFSFDNVLELALINGYAKAGVPPQLGVVIADATIRKLHDHGNAKGREWVVFVAGDLQTAQAADSLDEISFDELTSTQPNDAPVFSMVRVGEIVRRVKRLFATPEDAGERSATRAGRLVGEGR
ncbi:hypothetical protein LRP31_06690 [Mesorhizobium mediterraneum]|uniref:HTH merR-type domain-containing protein n=1 Tax=Mesorhizobium mediterraneum TaxID=43617 RepID=A0AB36R493_9HYPH|nr:hypothetical protein [Mesorhizobium mediterraneum]PAP99503.1 hypothetical protein CIT25_24200 [Mesorhizobium mediterraneum]RWN41634.1 MAG: hypothetical protein EOR96_12580 [Mesorhizobium sp.]WIW54917.1 hypothetical protein LRP31_06690 [Mesorhizobium mediterraneum]